MRKPITVANATRNYTVAAHKRNFSGFSHIVRLLLHSTTTRVAMPHSCAKKFHQHRYLFLLFSLALKELGIVQRHHHSRTIFERASQ